eukprot:6198421-Pleurochrysis_carterae.AAC.2
MTTGTSSAGSPLLNLTLECRACVIRRLTRQKRPSRLVFAGSRGVGCSAERSLAARSTPRFCHWHRRRRKAAAGGTRVRIASPSTPFEGLPSPPRLLLMYTIEHREPGQKNSRRRLALDSRA